MLDHNVKCLYCQSNNKLEDINCQHCGMPLATKHPESANTKQKAFKPIFIGIVIFCIVMMFYLPR
ncbi:MAG: DnrP protein [Thalassotalea sp.]